MSNRFVTAASILLFGLFSALSGTTVANGQHRGRDNDSTQQHRDHRDNRDNRDRGRSGQAHPGPRNTVSIPEPETLVLLITGLVATVLGVRARRQRE